MILTTTNSIEGFKIIDYKGIVSGVGMNMQKASMTFSMSKYYKAIEDSISVVSYRNSSFCHRTVTNQNFNHL